MQCPDVVPNAPSGDAEVKVTFDGKKGRSVDASVGPPFAGTPIEACIKRAYIDEIIVPFDGANIEMPTKVTLAAKAPAPDDKKKPKKMSTLRRAVSSRQPWRHRRDALGLGVFVASRVASAEDVEEPQHYPPSSVRLPIIMGGLGVAGAAYGLGALAAHYESDIPGAGALAIPVVGPVDRARSERLRHRRTPTAAACSTSAASCSRSRAWCRSPGSRSWARASS